MEPSFQENKLLICAIFVSKTKLIINIKAEPNINIYPVNKRGSKSGFNLLIKIKLKACVNIEIKTKISPTDIAVAPPDPVSDVTTIPINPRSEEHTSELQSRGH